jgi:hypothetical protein
MISGKACFFMKLGFALTEGIDPIIGQPREKNHARNTGQPCRRS